MKILDLCTNGQKPDAMSGLPVPWHAATSIHLSKHAWRGRAQHRVTGLPGRRGLALQARQAQAEHAIHARAVAAVQRIQLRLYVGEAHLHSDKGMETLHTRVQEETILQSNSVANK